MAFKRLDVGSLDVRTRLSLGFVAAVAFTVVACVLAIAALHHLRAVLEAVTDHHLPTIIAAYELAQQSKATVASAPNLVVSNTEGQRQTAYYRIRDQFAHSGELLRRLQEGDTPEDGVLGQIAGEHVHINATFEKLNEAVEQRIHHHRREETLLREFVEVRRAWPHGFESLPANSALDFLAISSATTTIPDLEEARAHYTKALAAAHTLPVPDKIMFKRLTALGQGEHNLFAAREGELRANERIDGLLTVYARLSDRLVAAVNALIVHRREAIIQANADSHALVRLQTGLLTILSVLCIAGGVLIAVHVSRTIISRLLRLHALMGIAATGRNVSIDCEGSDEIARMARAVEGFIAARDQAENALRAAKEEAENANQAKSRFLAAASHDLRQPLQALGLFVTALLDLRLEDDVRAVAERIARAVTALRELLDALLDISKLEAGVVVPDHTAVSLAPLIDRLAAEFAPTVAAGVRFRVGPCGGVVRSDSVLLERMVRNLLANALRYTVHGGVLIGCRRRGKTIRLEIWDTGLGIPEDQRQVIFREFYQINRAGRSAGVGLGLAIVDRTARLLGHRILVTSRLGRGSMFAIEMDATGEIPAQGEDTSAVTPVRALSGTGARCLDGRKIVVLDDDPRIRDGVSLLLKGWGCDVVTAASADEAIAALSRREMMPEAIIADYRLSDDETGDRAIAALRDAVEAPVPALLITGEISLEGLRHVHDVPVLRKPVASERLFAFLEKA
ncbi:MAG: periplasmic sensor hybrid histidine kinase, partial [Rhodospirillaceae bacterium]